MSEELYRTLRSLLGDREMVITAVPAHLLHKINGLTALVLHDPDEMPVLEAGVLHNMKYRALDYVFRHIEFDVAGLTAAQRVERIGQVLAVGIGQQTVPDLRTPLYLYIENGNRVWMRAAKEFRKQYRAAVAPR